MASDGLPALAAPNIGLDATALKAAGRSAARRHVTGWKDDVQALANHISSQMGYCQTLREHETLKKMMEEQPGKRDLRRIESIVASLKADCRVLLRELAAQSTSGAKVTIAGSKPGAGWEERTVELEQALKPFVVSSERREPFKLGDLVALLDLRQDLFVEAGETVIARKHAFDEMLGLAHDQVAPLETDEDVIQSSRLVKTTMRVMESVRDMEKLLRQHNLTVDGVTHGLALAKLEDRNAQLQAQLTYSQAMVQELQESCTRLKQASEGKPMGQQLIQLDDALHRVRNLEQQCAELKYLHAQVVARNGVLQDTMHVDVLQANLRDMQAKHIAETEWYIPRIRHLERDVKETSVKLELVRTDVELLSSMYKSGCDDLDAMQQQVDKANQERQLMGNKLAFEIKRLVLAEQDVERWKAMNLRLVAARRTAIESYRLSKNREAQLKASMAAMQKQMDGALQELDATKKNLQLESLAREEAQETVRQQVNDIEQLQTRLKIQQSQQLRISSELEEMTRKVIEAGLDEASAGRYEKLRAQFDESMEIQKAMDTQLQSAEKKIKTMQKKLDRWRDKMVAAGMEVEDAGN